MIRTSSKTIASIVSVLEYWSTLNTTHKLSGEKNQSQNGFLDIP